MDKYSEPGNPDQENYPASLDGTVDKEWVGAIEKDLGWQKEQEENQDE